MKRIQLFEIEDQSWFPNWTRKSMTRLLMVMHRFLGTTEHLSGLLKEALQQTGRRHIVDMCSGSGGPMPQVVQELREDEQFREVDLTLTDLYPDLDAARRFNSDQDRSITYREKPVDATRVEDTQDALRTMVCSFHHMRPEQAQAILEDAARSKAPICIYEISDNSTPTWLWWLAIPFNIISCLFITPFARPVTWYQLVFTYIIPIIPLCWAWDGAASNARTYTQRDLKEMTSRIAREGYEWKCGVIKGRSKNLYLLGTPS